MTERAQPGPRLLVVVSKDPNELALAMSFLRHQDIAQRTHVLVRKLPDATETPLLASATTSFYSALADIETAVEGFDPDFVILFSFYLFQFEGIATPRELGPFLQRLRKPGRRIVTSDPFLGLAHRLTVEDINSRMVALDWPRWSRPTIPLLMAMRGRRTSFIPMPSLEDVIHLYPIAAPDVSDRIERVSFFNPTYFRDASALVSSGDRENPKGPADGPVHWVFVLSESDIRYQCKLVGVREFTANVLQMLRYAVEVDRHPTLIAPPSMILRAAPAVSDWADLRPIDQFSQAERRVLEAEYAFFWDAFSMFQLPRLAAGLPVFPFDRGYFARTIRPYYESARECYLGGWEPTYLDQRQLFSPYVLAHLAKAQKPEMRALRERWQLSPTPDALVDQLLGQGTNTQSA